MIFFLFIILFCDLPGFQSADPISYSNKYDALSKIVHKEAHLNFSSNFKVYIQFEPLYGAFRFSYGHAGDHEFGYLNFKTYVHFSWKDDALSWKNIAVFKAIEYLIVESGAVWSPDVNFYPETVSESGNALGREMIHIQKDGTAYHRAILTFKLPCYARNGTYPRDTYTCFLYFYLRSVTRSYSLYKRLKCGNLDNGKDGQCFVNFENFKKQKISRYFKVSNFQVESNKLAISLNRRSGFTYEISVGIILGLVIIGVLLIPPGTKERLFVGLILFLNLDGYVYATLYMPEVRAGAADWITHFMLGLEGMQTIAIIWSILSYFLWKNASDESKMPDGLTNLLNQPLLRLVFLLPKPSNGGLEEPLAFSNPFMSFDERQETVAELNSVSEKVSRAEASVWHILVLLLDRILALVCFIVFLVVYFLSDIM